jgi:DNA-binding NtrC family response regulator
MLALQLYNEVVSRGSPLPLVATNAAQALAIVQHAPIDCAVVDPLLSGEDARPVIETLRRRAVPTVSVSGLPPNMMPGELSSFAFCRKPFDPELRIRVIEEAVDGRSLTIAAPRPERHRMFTVKRDSGEN